MKYKTVVIMFDSPKAIQTMDELLEKMEASFGPVFSMAPMKLPEFREEVIRFATGNEIKKVPTGKKSDHMVITFRRECD